MHYKNGREAKNGDRVIAFPSCGAPFAGILYDATAGNDYCNGKVAPTSPRDPCPNLKEVLHADDVTALCNPPQPQPVPDPAPAPAQEPPKEAAPATA
jgi:hypothetical protein